MMTEPNTATNTPNAFMTVFLGSLRIVAVIIRPIVEDLSAPSVNSNEGIIQLNTAATNVMDIVVIVGHIIGRQTLKN